MSDLFNVGVTTEPLAARMRPRSLDEFVGQPHILGPGRLLRRAILADQLTSVIFSGPPGCGKTTLSHVIAKTTKSAFFSLNAVLAGLADLREVIAKAQDFRKLYDRKTILFIDEVHRWNKAQQDALLPWTENGTIILIGATTENPYFKVNRALVSRSHIFQLLALTEQDLFNAAQSALHDKERGYGNYKINISEEALWHLIHFSSGDCRALFNALQLAIETTPKSFPPPQGESITIDLAIAEDSIQRKALAYDPSGDDHYDTISAFIKSVRGSDPDAALYWLAQMLHRGEDVDFIWRRLLILASEDIGLADYQAISVIQSCIYSFERIGLPEGYYPLAHATLYLTTCPKSNSVMGFFDALKEVEAGSRGDVPNHLRDASRDAAGFGHGQGYKYPHAYDEHWVAQQYLPVKLRGKIFYQPGDEGREKEIKDRMLAHREVQLAHGMEDFIPENYVASSHQEDKRWEAWWQRSSQLGAHALDQLRQQLYDTLALPDYSCVCIYGDMAGSLVMEALRRLRSGGVYVLLPSQRDAEALRFLTADLDTLHQPHLHIAQNYQAIPDAPLQYEAIVLYRPKESPAEILAMVRHQLAEGGQLAVVLPAQMTSLAQVFAPALSATQQENLKNAEQQLNKSLQQHHWKQALTELGMGTRVLEVRVEEEIKIPAQTLEKWLHPQAPLGVLLADAAPDILMALRGYNKTILWHRSYDIILTEKT